MEDSSGDKLWKDIGRFKIICKKCEKLGKKSHTRVYIDWDLKSYVFSCDECDTMEFFDEEGNPIKEEIVKEALEKEKEKLPN